MDYFFMFQERERERGREREREGEGEGGREGDMSSSLVQHQQQNYRTAVRACYLLRSKAPTKKGRTYVGFTVDPERRIRQHNGEIVSGAKSTRSGRPWDMLMVVSGFHTKVGTRTSQRKKSGICYH